MAIATLVAGCRGGAGRPNVVLLSIDCLNARQLQGAIERGLMPAIAQLESEATVFTRAHANAPWTTPSHMTMLTGLYPSQHGRDISVHLMTQVNNFYDRVPRFRTVAEYLHDAGYATAAFVGKGAMSAEFGFAQGFDQFVESPKQGRPDFETALTALGQWLDGHEGAPFFAFVHTYDLHTPRVREYTAEDDALHGIDQSVGRLVADLRQRGLYDRTAIFVTGDHGSIMLKSEGKCCSHGLGHYEENLHVPLVLKLPGAPPGRRSDLLVRHVDILPTMLELTGTDAGGYAGPGESMLATLRAGTTADRFSYSEADASCVERRALVNERYKYIYTPKDDRQLLLEMYWRFTGLCPASCFALPLEELFDLRSDPTEDRNLIGTDLDAEQTQWLARFREQMAADMNLPRAYVQRVFTDQDRVHAAPVTESVHKALKALGYVQ
ncbi:MAG TPA: sulfatase [Candidatus Binatia bacterium]|nr:sulfatase [Candidatus Binatia bacterium]